VSIAVAECGQHFEAPPQRLVGQRTRTRTNTIPYGTEASAAAPRVSRSQRCSLPATQQREHRRWSQTVCEVVRSDPKGHCAHREHGQHKHPFTLGRLELGLVVGRAQAGLRRDSTILRVIDTHVALAGLCAQHGGGGGGIRSYGRS